MKRLLMGTCMNMTLSISNPRVASIAGTALHTAFPLWLLVAAILAATMGTWPPHVYI